MSKEEKKRGILTKLLLNGTVVTKEITYFVSYRLKESSTSHSYPLKGKRMRHAAMIVEYHISESILSDVNPLWE